MSLPVQLSGLDLVTVADDDDLTLIRKDNTTDYKITCQKLRNINIAGLPELPTTANSPLTSDLLLVARGGTNSKCYFGAIGFLKDTQMWFYMNDAPNGVAPIFWESITGSGGNLLAVRGGSTYVTGGANSGTWQQTGAGLTAAQNGPHFHVIEQGRLTAEDDTSASPTYPRLGKDIATLSSPAQKALTNASGTGALHNHGNTWRPLASVGLLCKKML